jgi:hypothetical protein
MNPPRSSLHLRSAGERQSFRPAGGCGVATGAGGSYSRLPRNGPATKLGGARVAREKVSPPGGAEIDHDKRKSAKGRRWGCSFRPSPRPRLPLVRPSLTAPAPASSDIPSHVGFNAALLVLCVGLQYSLWNTEYEGKPGIPSAVGVDSRKRSSLPVPGCHNAASRRHRHSPSPPDAL